MERISYKSTKSTLEVVLYLWWMVSIVGLFIGTTNWLILLTTGTLLMKVSLWVGMVMIAGIIVPGLWFRYIAKQED